ncbi:MAG TPA: TonB-dependent receptor [Burkholderiales bacterium]|nr:TonB-dependent receptor [Burkholderiales bacterium]
MPHSAVPFRLRAVAVFVAAACASSSVTALAEETPATGTKSPETTRSLEAPQVDVVGTTPVPGLGSPKNEVPANVQILTPKDIEQQRPLDLPDLLDATTTSVNVNNFQGNPYQPQVNYRGFGASPLLGEPVGLSVFQDGVRVNEPFGDVVQWDLIPTGALATVDVLPGSNPLFGLNTLGGAMALRTKSGAFFPDTGVQAYGGSWGRYAVQAEQGGYMDNGLDYYFFGNFFDEDGWRDFSPSQVSQFFTKVGWQSGGTDVDLSVTRVHSNLIGNGVTPQSFLDRSWSSIFTRPDQTVNSLWMTNLTASHWLNDSLLLSGQGYYRSLVRQTANGDVNDEFENNPNANGAFGANGGLGFNIDTAANNVTNTSTRGLGGALLLTWLAESNELKGGVSYDQANSGFYQSTALGIFDPTRQPLSTSGPDVQASLTGSTKTWSLLATDTYRLTGLVDGLAATVSGRYNHSEVETVDRLTPIPPNLNGNFTYTKFNPAAGLTYSPFETLNFFGGWSQGNRVPTPIELGCADPLNPCTLPAGLASDPYLNQVTAQTWELGARGMLTSEITGNVNWNFALFNTNNKDDILFVGTSTSAGFFTNYGETRRRGAELGFNGSTPRLNWFINFAYIDATFQSDACLMSENNSTRGTSPRCTNSATGAGDDLILVQSGDRIPGIPQFQGRAFAEYRLFDGFWIGGNVAVFTDQYVRGNENNQTQVGTYSDITGNARTFLGSGTAGGYAVVNLNLRYRPDPQWEIFARVNNLFDRKFYTGGMMAENPFNNAGVFQTNTNDWTRQTFYAPGAPLAAWVGVRFLLERPPRQ